MNPLEAELKATIQSEGPLSVAAWMTTCLLHPLHGYYATGRPIGGEGDFTTAPEVSQMFGELIGVWLMSAWRLMGSPARVAVVELGPGRGTLMADVQRTARAVPDFAEAASYNLVEAGGAMREEQRSRVTGAWHDDWAAFDRVADGPVLVVANEYLDALPFHQFVRGADGWRERGVGWDDGLAFVEMAGEMELPDAEEGTVVEVAPAREAAVALVAERIARKGGAALFIDYGSLSRGTGDTLQAVRAHQRVDPLMEPGRVDLTSHVDFAALVRAARPCETQTATQGDFLLNLGLLERAGALGAARDAAFQEQVSADARRLAHPDGMGELFKVLAVRCPELPPLPGFGEME